MLQSVVHLPMISSIHVSAYCTQDVLWHKRRPLCRCYINAGTVAENVRHPKVFRPRQIIRVPRLKCRYLPSPTHALYYTQRPVPLCWRLAGVGSAIGQRQGDFGRTEPQQPNNIKGGYRCQRTDVALWLREAEEMQYSKQYRRTVQSQMLHSNWTP